MPQKPTHPERRVTARDARCLLETLTSEACDDNDDNADSDAKVAALRDLCPCRSRRYDRDVWAAIFHAHAANGDAAVRDQAGHAIDELKNRVRTDPRTQTLVLELAGEIPAAAPLAALVPVWNPRPAGKGRLPVIPRFERGHRSNRSKKNKPR